MLGKHKISRNANLFQFVKPPVTTLAKRFKLVWTKSFGEIKKNPLSADSKLKSPRRHNKQIRKNSFQQVH
jgi:hypothetical protein